MKSKNYGLLFAILSPLLSSIGTILSAAAVKILSPLFAASIAGIFGSLILLFSMTFFKEKINFSKLKENIRDILGMLLTRGIFGAAAITIGLSMTDGIKAIFFSKICAWFY